MTVKLYKEEVKHPNFVNLGKIYLTRCILCEKENYALSVTSGQCAWCGAEYILREKEND